MLEGVVVELLLTNGGIGLLDRRGHARNINKRGDGCLLSVHVRVRDGSGGMHE